jgi:hypothetical protein
VIDLNAASDVLVYVDGADGESARQMIRARRRADRRRSWHFGP